jgi:menaquinone-dependent protoporphyrinogen oxidase
MRILIVYGTSEGQTRKVAGAMATTLTGFGHDAHGIDVADGAAASRLAGVGAVIVAGSIHVGRYQRALARFVRDNCPLIADRPNLFVSVSLAAAGTDPKDREGIAACAEKLAAETGWRPEEVVHVAGAFRFTQYGFFKRLLMRGNARRMRVAFDPWGDTELTDWAALREATEAFAERAAAATRHAGGPARPGTAAAPAARSGATREAATGKPATGKPEAGKPEAGGAAAAGAASDPEAA